MANLATSLMLSTMLLTAACASTSGKTRPGEPDKIAQAISEPFRDLNLVREQQAPALTRAAEQPYGAPRDCATATQQLAALNAALGPDIDAPASSSNEAAELAGNAIAGVVSDVVRLPFRGVIRRVTGAEKRAKNDSHAAFAGGLRRAYLKGFVAGACSGAAEEGPEGSS